MTAEEATTVARGMHAKALRHKRLANYHREKTRHLMRRYKSFVDRLAEMGVAVRGEGAAVHGHEENSENTGSNTTTR